MSPRSKYALLFAGLLAVEVFIACFIHDRFIRPYLGDVLVVVVLYAFLRVPWPTGLPWLPAAVTLFAVAVEVGQAFHMVERLGLEHIPFFRILLGATFDWADLLCYLAGGCLIYLAEYVHRKRMEKKREDRPGGRCS